MTEESEQQGAGPAALRRRRRTRWTIVAVAGLAVVGIGATVVLSSALADTEPPPPTGPETATATVRKTDLAETETVTGDLGYGPRRPLSGRADGTLTGLPETGEVLERGEQVYTVDAEPVVLFYGDLPLYRELSSDVDNGPDVELVERNLAELGFGGFGEPDENVTWATERALRNWQESLGLEETGEIGPGDVAVQPGAVRVAEVTAELGAQAGGQLMQVTGNERLVTAELELSKQDIAKPDSAVGIELPDGGTTTGKVASASPKSGSDDEQQGAPGGGGQEAKLEVIIALDQEQAAEGLGAVPVSVTFTSDTAEGVLVVPIGALVALREGGHAVEVVENGENRLVEVRPGLFANGQVEVTGDGLAEGMTVVTTS